MATTDVGAEALRAGLAGTHDQRAAAFTALLDRSLDRSYPACRGHPGRS